jgi:predicted ArsR family transcriptional regulator
MTHAAFVVQPPTSRERQVLACMRRFIRTYRMAPTRTELASDLGISGPTVQLHLQALQTKGHVQLFPRQWRGAFPVGTPIAYRSTPRGDVAVVATSRRRA